MRTLKELVLILLSVALQSQWSRLDAFDLLVLISFFIVMRFSWVEGAVFAFIGGLIWDSLSGTPMGLKSISLVGGCFFVGIFHSIIYQGHFLARFLIVFIGTFFGLSLEWLIYTFSGLVHPMIVSSIVVSGLWTGLLALAIYPLLNWIFRETYGNWMVS